MDDFRSQLTAVIDAMLAEGQQPAFLVVDLQGADYIKKAHGAESLEKFKEAAIRAVVGATGGADAFTYGEERVVAILGGQFDRLKTFSVIQKLRRAIPLLGQSFDCYLMPECDLIDYDPATGAAGLIQHIAKPRRRAEDIAA